MPGLNGCHEYATADLKGWSATCQKDEFSVGEVVEYWSATHSKWLSARVLRLNLDGTLDLDCKAGALIQLVRRSGAELQQVHAQPRFSLGDDVEYYSTTYGGKWIPAQVISVGDGKYTLNCKPDVPADRVRRPETQAPSPAPAAHVASGAPLVEPRAPPVSSPGLTGESSEGLHPGESVEYFSSTNKRWMPATVIRINADGTVDLDCRASALPRNIRRLDLPAALLDQTPGPDRAPHHMTPRGQQTLVPAEARGPCEPAARLPEVAARRQGQSPSAVIQEARGPCEPASCPLEPAAHRTDHAQYMPRVESPGPCVASGCTLICSPGDEVEYYSTTHGRWVPGTVTSFGPGGTYNLSCKANVDPRLLRKPLARAAADRPPAAAARVAAERPAAAAGVVPATIDATAGRDLRSPDPARPDGESRLQQAVELDRGCLAARAAHLNLTPIAESTLAGTPERMTLAAPASPALSTSSSSSSESVATSVSTQSTASTPAPPSSNSVAPRGGAVLCFGDSLTQGYSFAFAHLPFSPYGDQLSQRLRGKGVSVITKGQCGSTTRDMLERLPPALQAGSGGSAAPKRFNLVLILGGTNDLNFGHSKEEILKNLLMLHEAALQTGARTAVITIPFLRSTVGQQKVDADRRWVNASLCQFAAADPDRRLQIDLASRIPQDAAHSGLWDPDGVHLTPSGYRVMGEMIADAVCGAGKKCVVQRSSYG